MTDVSTQTDENNELKSYQHNIPSTADIPAPLPDNTISISLVYKSNNDDPSAGTKLQEIYRGSLDDLPKSKCFCLPCPSDKFNSNGSTICVSCFHLSFNHFNTSTKLLLVDGVKIPENSTETFEKHTCDLCHAECIMLPCIRTTRIQVQRSCTLPPARQEMT